MAEIQKLEIPVKACIASHSSVTSASSTGQLVAWPVHLEFDIIGRTSNPHTLLVEARNFNIDDLKLIFYILYYIDRQ